MHSKEAKTVSVRSTGAEKRRLRVVLAATADGQMLPPMVIFKGKRKLKNIDVYPGHGLYVFKLKAGWIAC